MLGSSFADTEILLSTDTSHLSAAFTANNVGYLAGSVLCALLCDRFHPEPQQALVIILVALSTAVAPFYKNITWFISVMVIQGVGMAYIDSGKLTSDIYNIENGCTLTVDCIGNT